VILLSVFVLRGLSDRAAPRAWAQEKPKARFNIDYDADNYPQNSPKACLGSVIKAIDARRIDYLLAQLADPQYVDARVKGLDGNFREMVKETTERLAADPTIVRELRRFLSSGDWEEGEEAASAKLKDVKNRAVFLKKINDRWYFENRQKAEVKEK
jgi:hypothetical protein